MWNAVMAQCNYSVELSDSYGDGWNGNTMDVLVNGAVVLDDITLGGGSGPEAFPIPVTTGDDVTAIWNGGGSYASEASFEIKDADGTVVASSGLGGSVPNNIIAGTVTAACPMCGAPNGASLATATGTSATITYNDGLGCVTGAQIEYGTAGFTVGTGATVNVACGVGSVDLTGLTAFTDYQAYFTTDCGGSTSATAGPFSFNSGTAPPACGGKFYDSGGPSADYSLNENITTTICPGNAGDVVTVTFLSYDTESGYDFLSVYNGADATAVNIESNYSGTTAPGPYTSTDASGCLTFVFTSDGFVTKAGWDADVTCAPPPACPVPNGLSATPTNVSVELSWGGVGSAVTYDYLVVPTGTVVDASTLPTGNTANTTVQTGGLTPTTGYDAYVRSICTGGDMSDWSGAVMFTTLATPPANDDCADAATLTASTIGTCDASLSGTTQGASPSTENVCSTTSNDVYYTFTAPATDSYNFSVTETFDSGFGSTYVSVYTGTCAGGLTAVSTSCFSTSANDLALTQGEVYTVIVRYTGSTTYSEFDLCVSASPPPPGNDECADATTLGVSANGTCTTSETINLTSATDSPLNPSCDNFGTNVDVYFTFTSTTGSVIINITGSTTVEAAVFTDCAQTTELFCSDGSTDGKMITGLTPNTAYVLNVWQDSPTVAFDLCLEEGPSCLPVSSVSSSSVLETTAEITFTGNASAVSYTVEYSTDAAFVPGGGTGTIVSGAASPIGLTGLTGTTTYYYAVRAECGVGSSSDYSSVLSFTTTAPAPANDACADAIALNDASGIPSAASGTTFNSTGADPAQSVAAVTCNGFTGNADDDTWFVVNVPTNSSVTITVAGGTGYDAVIQAYSGSCAALVAEECADATTGGGTETLTLTDSGPPALLATTFLVQVFDYDAGGAEFTISVNSAALPAELVAFTGTAETLANRLDWTTATEANVNYFAVERSADGNDWTTVGEVTAAGNSSVAVDYAFLDRQPLSLAYYRLRTVDFDGYTEYSDVVQISRPRGNGDVVIAPNPTRGETILSIDLDRNDDLTLIITDVTGRVVSRTAYSLTEGAHTVALDMSRYASGVYFLQLQGRTLQLTERLVKE